MQIGQDVQMKKVWEMMIGQLKVLILKKIMYGKVLGVMNLSKRRKERRGVGVVDLIKLVSFNMRGLGGEEKRREVQRLIRENCSLVVCIQEMKNGNDFMSRYMWGVP